MFHFVQQQSDLEKILIQMEHCPAYGLDTEFIKVDTLWPRLGVFQINLEGQIYLLDGVNLDLTAFWPKIYQANQIVFHACSEDVDLIYHYAQRKPLTNVFDTQIGLAFLGHGLQMSYQSALKLVLGIDIEKDQTRSNWLARPLSQEQMNYAANDVIYLADLAVQVQKKLKHQGLYECVLEDCQHLAAEIAEDTLVDRLYLDVGNYRHSRKQLMQLQQLSIWREQLIRALDQPRSFILKNSTMIDLVEKNPKNNFQLAQVKDIRPNVIREHGKTILDLLRFLPPENRWPHRLARPVKHCSQDVAEQMEQLIQQIVQRTHIPKEILIRKKWLNSLYHHVVFSKDKDGLSPYLLGWRYEIITQPLIEILKQDRNYLLKQMNVEASYQW